MKCHGGAERNGGFSFDDRTSLFAEADSGERPVIPGKPADSELIKRVTATDEDLRMPPEHDPLPDENVRRLVEWIARGAEWSPTGNPVAPAAVTSSHWAFQPLADQQPPPVHDGQWARGPLDRFLQARRESAGLTVAADADPAVLIRRATYDLTGLPPTPEEVRRFLAAVQSRGLDESLAELVDELLARPSYGERWGRHWMDWVRYADTAGDNSDFPIPQAYLYRNYIIDSLNRDVPYDRFLTEQLAGDLLPADSLEERNRQTIATGYLAMARRFGSLVERYPWHLTIEDTIDNIGRTMLGLTLSCARCHDHKFDPISTRDYYGLYGILASTRYPFPGIELFQTQRDLVPLIPASEASATLKPHRAETDKLAAELDRLLSVSRKRALEIAAGESQATLDEQRRAQDELDGLLIKARRAGEALAEHLKQVPPIPSAYAVQDSNPEDAHIQIKGEPDRPGALVPRKFPEILGGQTLPPAASQSSSGRRELANWITSPGNPLTARVIVNRIWQRHFGVGIVPTTSDFGLRGQAPTHPELLDWLASDFIRSGWSIKQLHRTIMNSRTWRLSSRDDPSNLASDPDNKFYWRFNRQRLDAESLRDTLLMISGSLDLQPQIEPYPIPPSAKWEYTQHHPFKDDYPSRKRSVYLMTKRLTANPYFQTFDGPDPNVCTSDRDQSVTPLQALYFVNDESLHEQARLYAELLLSSFDSDEDRAQSAFWRILCREPTDEESDFMIKHVSAVEARLGSGSQAQQEAWASLVRSLLRLNEFLYID